MKITAKQKFEQDFRRDLKAWQKKIDAIKSKAGQVHAQNLLEFERQLDLLFAKHQLAGERLKKLLASPDSDWTDLQASLDGLRNEIENALDSAAAKIERFL